MFSPTMPVAVACTSTGGCGIAFARSAEVSTNASAPSTGQVHVEHAQRLTDHARRVVVVERDRRADRGERVPQRVACGRSPRCAPTPRASRRTRGGSDSPTPRRRRPGRCPRGRGERRCAVRRRNGSFAALRDAQGSRSIDDTTSTVSAQPEKIAFTASTIANMTTGDGRVQWVTVSSPSDDANICGLGAPGSPTATTPSMSAARRPASRIACVAASSPSASALRSFVRVKPVLPMPTIATWSLTGLRAITEPRRSPRAGTPGTGCRCARST